MKSILKKTTVLLFLVMTLMSCSKNGDNLIDTGKGLSGSLLLVEEKINGQAAHKFEYDDRNRVSVRHVYGVDGNIYTENFTYDNSDRVTGVVHSGGLIETYFYDDGDKPTSGVWTDNTTTKAVQFAYSQNKVTETHVWDDQSMVYIYTSDNKGNLAIVRTNSGGEGESITEFGAYDDKPSCYTNYPWSWKGRYINNYGSVKISGTGMVLADHMLEYTYNDAGYPVKAEVYDRESKELLETREYSYKNAN